MYKIIFVLICVFYMVLVSSCVPMSSMYFRPSGTGGEIVKSLCGSGPEDKIQFSSESGVKIFVKVKSIDNNSISIGVSIPKNNKVKFNGITFIIRDIESDYKKIMKVSTVESFWFSEKQQKYSITDMLIGDTYTRKMSFGENVRHKVFGVHLYVNVNKFRNFSLELPDLLINNKLFNLPLINFNLERDLSLYLINC